MFRNRDYRRSPVVIDTAPSRTCHVVGVLVGLLIAIELARNLPDVLRYLKLKAM